MSLFRDLEQQEVDSAKPLAARMRPRTLDEFTGQLHFLGEGKLLRRILDADRLSSAVFYGPPGTGKTTLAEIVATKTERTFVSLNAAACGVKELREVLEEARTRLATRGVRTLLFIDELHHFNKLQQDVLLPDVEAGIVSLIGATTSNPFFALVSALISRSQVFEFQPLTQDDLLMLMRRALADTERGLGKRKLSIDDDASAFLADVCDGDARRALMALEIAALSLPLGAKQITLEIAQESIQKKAVRYDANGDDHYDAASALIKSMRGSDPDATAYWLARMWEAGEDPRFLARRIVIAASEDIGNADPNALVIANAAAQATEFVGRPECRIILMQAALYVAMAPKSNASIKAVDSALEDVRTHSVIPVPMHLRDGHYAGSKRMGHGEGYQYAHNSEEGWVDQDYLGVEKTYYEPVDRGTEAEFKKRLDDLRERREGGSRSGTPES